MSSGDVRIYITRHAFSKVLWRCTHIHHSIMISCTHDSVHTCSNRRTATCARICYIVLNVRIYITLLLTYAYILNCYNDNEHILCGIATLFSQYMTFIATYQHTRVYYTVINMRVYITVLLAYACILHSYPGNEQILRTIATPYSQYMTFTCAYILQCY